MILFGPPDVEKLKARGKVRRLVRTLGYKKDPQVRQAAAEALAEIGAAAVAPLLAGLSGMDAEARRSAVEILGRIGDTRAVRTLSVLLHQDDSDDVRQAAGRALSQIGAPAVNQYLEAQRLTDQLRRERVMAQAARSSGLLRRIRLPQGAEEPGQVGTRPQEEGAALRAAPAQPQEGEERSQTAEAQPQGLPDLAAPAPHKVRRETPSTKPTRQPTAALTDTALESPPRAAQSSRTIEQVEEGSEEYARTAARLRPQLALLAVVLIIAAVLFGLEINELTRQRDQAQAAAAGAQAAAATSDAAAASAAAVAAAQRQTAQANAEARATAEVLLQHERTAAQEQARQARAVHLALQAQAIAEIAPQRSLLLAIEAIRITLLAGDPRIPLTETALRQALSATGGEPVAGHHAHVSAVAFSPDGKWLATGSQDGTVRLWEQDNPAAEPIVLREHGGAINALAFSADRQWLASGSADRTVRLWKVADPWTEPTILRGHEDDVNGLCFSPDGEWLATAGSWDGTVRVWDLTEPTSETIVLRGEERWIGTLAFSPDGRWLATAGGDGIVRLWDTSVWALAPAVLPRQEDPILTLAFGPDGRYLVTGSERGQVLLWDLENAAASPGELGSIERRITALAYSPDGRWLAAGCGDGRARLWDMAQASAGPLVLPGYQGGLGLALQVAFSPDGNRLATAGCEQVERGSCTFGTVRLWQLPRITVNEPILLYGQVAGIDAAAFSPDGHWLAAASWDIVELLDTSNLGVEPIVLQGQGWIIDAVIFSPDGRWLVTKEHELKDVGATEIGGDAVLRWAVADPSTDPIRIESAAGTIDHIAVSPDGKWLATAGSDLVPRLWDMSNPAREPIGLSEMEAVIVEMTFSPDGRWLAISSGDGTVRLWEVTDPSFESLTLPKRTGWIRLAFSFDGHWLAAGSEDGALRVWDLGETAATEVLYAPGGPGESIDALAFSPDGCWLAAGGRGLTVRVWDMERLQEGATVLRGHGERIEALAFSPDGRWLATGDGDGELRLWEVQDLAAGPLVLPGYGNRIRSLAFSPEGRWLASVSWEGTARLWRVQLEDLLELACRTAGRNLSQEEWVQYFPDEPYHRTCLQWPAGR